MSNFKWTPDLDTGIPVIDKQHRRIVEYIITLDDIQSGDRDEVGRVLEELIDYTLSHFAFEEGLMEESGYRFVNAHKKVHNLFVRRVGSYVERFKVGEDITDELVVTLKTWLLNHIRNDDDDYAEVVKKNLGEDEAIEEEPKGWFQRSLNKMFGE